MACPAWCDTPGCTLKYAAHLSFHIHSSAKPTSANPATVAANRRERDLERDMPAYREARRQGLQPKQIDGCADLLARASTEMEVESGHLLPTKAQQQTARSVLEDMNAA